MKRPLIRTLLIGFVWFVLLYAVLFFVITSVANAAGVDNRVHVRSVYAAAQATWKPDHCPNRTVALYTYDPATDEPTEGDPDVIAYVPYLGACEIRFNVEHDYNYHRELFYSVFIHEMGHVAFAEHNGDNRDIMYPFAGVLWGGNFLVSGQLQQRFKRRYRNPWDYSTAHRPIPAPRSTAATNDTPDLTRREARESRRGMVRL